MGSSDPRPLRTSTRTVAFTDLANYTRRVANTDREGLRRILQEHESLVAPIVERHGGRVVKNLGDSYMVLFEAATDAVRAALEIVAMVGDGAPTLRVAMTTGDVEEIEGDAFGESVNLAARILQKTPSGEVWFGPGTRVCMNASEIPWESVGRFGLKGVPGEKEVFRAVPEHQCWLPEPVVQAARQGRLVRLKRGAQRPLLPPDPVVMLEGFTPGSPALMDAVDGLPVLNPASLWLNGYNIASEDRNAWTDAGRGLVIGTPAAVHTAVEEASKVVSRPAGADTIVFDSGGVQSDVELVMCGLALPAVPLHEVVSSYFYDFLPDGRWVNRSDRSLLRVEVTPEGTRLHALSPGITSNGRGVSSGDAVPLADGDEVGTPLGLMRFESSNHGYAGIVIYESGMRLGVVSGTTAELGREPRPPGLAFPDRRGQDNIRWCPGQRAARARANGFTLDRALAGRRQAAIQVGDNAIRLQPLHPRCATYMLRSGTQDLELADRVLDLQLGDRVVAGTTVVGLQAPAAE